MFEIYYFSDPEISFWKPLNIESRWFFSCPFSCKEIKFSNYPQKNFSCPFSCKDIQVVHIKKVVESWHGFWKCPKCHLIGCVDDASSAAAVIYTRHRPEKVKMKGRKHEIPSTNWQVKSQKYRMASITFQVPSPKYQKGKYQVPIGKFNLPIALFLDTALGHIGIRLAKISSGKYQVKLPNYHWYS